MDLLQFAHLLKSLLMIAMPIGLGLYLVRKFRLSWWLWWIGAGTFVLSQVGHIPFNAALTVLFQRGILPTPPDAWQLPVNVVMLGLSAGLWEELFRYGTYKWWASTARSWRKGLVLGAGHGGIEAIILGGLALVAFASMSNLRHADLSTIVPPEQLALAQQQMSAYWGSPWYLVMFGAVERLLTLPIHLALSVIVLQAFTRNRFIWVWFAVFWHAAANTSALLVMSNYGALAAEGCVAVFSIGSLVIIKALYTPEPLETDIPALPVVSPVRLSPIEPSIENIENTRYNG